MTTDDSAGRRRIVVVEDDAKIAAVLRDYLLAEGHAPTLVHNGTQAVDVIRAQSPSAVLLDLMLPGLDGLQVCQAVRLFSDVPIIMLTARVDEIDRLLGLNTGADDYVCKPFSPREVVARVAAQIRRAEGRVAAAAGSAPATPWQVDEAGQRISWRRQALALTPQEYRLLRLLLGAPGRVFSRAQLLDAMHADARDVSDRAIDSHVKNLRRKLLAADAAADCIASVYGVGYRFEAPPG
jgi:two-component system response regulator BaeR